MDNNRILPAPRPPLLVILPPPVLYALSFAVGLGIDRAAPWSPGWMRAAPAQGAGWLLLGAGAALALAGIGLLHRRRTTLIPFGQPARLITDGPFALSRNPIYLALTAAYCGVAVLTARAWPLVVLPVPLAVLQRVVIPFEERRLRAAFGDSYAAYCRRVRRWL